MTDRSHGSVLNSLFLTTSQQHHDKVGPESWCLVLHQNVVSRVH